MVSLNAWKYVIMFTSYVFRSLVPTSTTFLCVTQELLMAGADPNAVDGDSESILHIAVAKRYTDCAIVILENGGCSSMSIPNSQNKT
jgi:ankyrin repeat protein